jgi:hypothetical protein
MPRHIGGGRNDATAQIKFSSIVGTFFAHAHYRSDIASMAAWGGSLEHFNYGTKRCAP